MTRRSIRKAKNTSRHMKTDQQKIMKTQSKAPKIPGWDAEKSYQENIQKLGIVTKVNQNVNNYIKTMNDKRTINSKVKQGLIPKPENQTIDVDEVDFADMEDIIKRKRLPDSEYTQKIKLSVDEQWAIEAIVKRYGTDFGRAYLDVKKNKFQWTKNQLTKQYDMYLRRHGKCPK